MTGPCDAREHTRSPLDHPINSLNLASSPNSANLPDSESTSETADRGAMFKSTTKLNGGAGAGKEPNVAPDASLLIKEGYITKLRSKNRRYFVLYTENELEFARLYYYENEKRFRTSPAGYKRSIVLKDCFAVIKKYDPRFKKNEIFVFAIYTRDDCFSLMFDNQAEMNIWFSLINEVHLKSLAKNRSNAIHDYDKIWYTVVKDKKSHLKGSFYLCLTSEEIHLYKINNLKEHTKRLSSSSDTSGKDVVDQATNSANAANSLSVSLSRQSSSLGKLDLSSQANTLDVYRFPFSLIRKFGHHSNSVFIELGRSSDFGSCRLWFELRDCDTSTHIHTLVVAATKAAKNNNEFRTRSNSENNRLFRKLRKSASDKQAVNAKDSLSISKSNTNSSINQLSNSTPSSKSSCSLQRFNPANIHKLIGSSESKLKQEKEQQSSTEYIACTVAYTSVAYTLPSNQLPVRSRSTSESSSSQAVLLAQQKGLQNLYKAKQLLNSQASNPTPKSSPNNTQHILSNESLPNDDVSDYYITGPTQQHPSGRLDDHQQDDYLMVDGLSGGLQSPRDGLQSPRDERTFSNASTIQFNRLDTMKRSDFKVVQSSSSKLSSSSAGSSPGGFVIETAQHSYKPMHTQYYSPVNNSFVDLPDPLQEELNENDQVDEYIQIELGEKKSANAVQGSGGKEGDERTDENADEREEKDYIGVDSFSSNTATNAEASENLSPISSTSCNMLSRVKTFSTSSNTSNELVNSLGTSPSLISNYKLENVLSYFQTPEDGLDFIRPARAYSIGTRDRPKLSNMSKMKHCPAMTKSKSNTINGPTYTGSLISANRKVQCGHLIGDQTCGHHCVDEFEFATDSNRVRALSMGAHTTNCRDKRELLKKIRLSDFKKQHDGDGSSQAKKANSMIEDEETKCLSTPNMVENNSYAHRHRSATFVSYASTASTSSKTVNEESSNEEDDLMMIDLSKSAARFENDQFYNHNQISIKEKFNQLNLDELK